MRAAVYHRYRVEPPLPEARIPLEFVLVMGCHRGNVLTVAHGRLTSVTVDERDADDVRRLLRKQRRALVLAEPGAP